MVHETLGLELLMVSEFSTEKRGRIGKERAAKRDGTTARASDCRDPKGRLPNWKRKPGCARKRGRNLGAKRPGVEKREKNSIATAFLGFFQKTGG